MANVKYTAKAPAAATAKKSAVVPASSAAVLGGEALKTKTKRRQKPAVVAIKRIKGQEAKFGASAYEIPRSVFTEHLKRLASTDEIQRPAQIPATFKEGLGEHVRPYPHPPSTKGLRFQRPALHAFQRAMEANLVRIIEGANTIRRGACRTGTKSPTKTLHNKHVISVLAARPELRYVYDAVVAQVFVAPSVPSGKAVTPEDRILNDTFVSE
jgi:hypothetical protein